MAAWRYLEVGGYKVKIDKEDFLRISRFTWRIRHREDSEKLSVITSIRTNKGSRNMSLGNFLMKPPKGKFVYPRRYQEGLDFRKSNLIVCTLKERQRMLPKTKGRASSDYRGVSFVEGTKKWRAGITVEGKSYNLGVYKTENQAALAYNKAASKYFGKNAYQNTIHRGARSHRKK